MDRVYRTTKMTTWILLLARNTGYRHSGGINAGCYIVGTRYRSRCCKLELLSQN